jgi:tRNA threonylcarbamoyladenosine biosynthesis protein TsaE
MSAPLELVLRSPAEMIALGAALGRAAAAGDVFALNGPLGAGKTHLVKGLAAGLGVPSDEPVVSPTFVLAREYAGRLKLVHLDAYRLSSGEELRAIGWDELLETPGVVLAIEWAERVAEVIPATAVWIELAHAGGDVRRAAITAADPRRLRTLQAAAAACDRPG